MTTPFPTPGDDADASAPKGLEHVAAWAAAVVSRAAGEEPPVLPGIVGPLDFRADFAVNAQADAASVTLGRGTVRLSGAGTAATSGALSLSLRWSAGYRAGGLSVGDELAGEWIVAAVDATRLDLRHAALDADVREAAVPVVTIVKPSAATAGDEFTARLWGEAPGCRDAAIRGWAHG